MNWTDLLIIYLAAGAPFAVQDYLSREPGPGSAVRSAANGLLWVFRIPRLLHGLVTSLLSESGMRTRLEKSIARDLESRLMAGSELHEVFRIREVLGRYEGLSDALNESDGESVDTQFFEIADHPDPDLAGHVLARRVRKELEARREAAGSELIDLCASAVFSPQGNHDSFDALIRLFRRFDDRQAISRLGDVIGEQSPARTQPSGWGGTLWNGSFAKQHIIRSRSIGLQDLTRTPTRPAGDWKD